MSEIFSFGALLAASGLNDFGNDIPLLTLLLVVPVVGAIVAAMLPHNDAQPSRNVAIATSAITFLLSVVLLLAFDRHDAGYQFVSRHEWFPDFGIQWKLGVDGISLFLVVLTGLIFPIALISWKVEALPRAYYAWMLLLEAGCLASFLALDLFLFFVAFEAVLVPMYFLIAGWGFAKRAYAALKFFIYAFASSAVMFVGMLALVFLTADQTGKTITFDVEVLQAADALSSTEARWVFFAFAIAFAVKIPIVPLHTWLPDAYEQAPIAGVVVSTAVMVKLGTYGLVRFGVAMFPEAANDLAPLLLTLAVIGMIYGAIVAAAQHDLKRLMAYSSLSNLGFIVLGTFAFSPQGLSGAVLQMINHGITAAALFLLVGMIYARRRTTALRELRGIQKAAPVMAAVMTICVMSSIGVPGLNGFIGEFLILSGTFVSHRWWAVVATSAVVFAALYLLWAYQQMFHGEADADNASVSDLSHRERWLMAPLVAAIVFIGVYPTPLLDRIEPSVDRILDDVPAQTADAVAQPEAQR